MGETFKTGESEVNSKEVSRSRTYGMYVQQSISMLYTYQGRLLLQNEKLLTHPVVTSLLRWKWIRYLAWFYFINLLVYLFFLSFLTAFALTVPNPQRSVCKRNETPAFRLIYDPLLHNVEAMLCSS